MTADVTAVMIAEEKAMIVVEEDVAEKAVAETTLMPRTWFRSLPSHYSSVLSLYSLATSRR